MSHIFDEVPEVIDEDYNEFLEALGGYDAQTATDLTHDGYPLNTKEAKFISVFVATGNVTKAFKESNAPRCTIQRDYVIEEIRWRMNKLKKKTIADADEVMEYFTAVMRGEIRDQFNIEASLSERTRAAQELAKRTFDIEQKMVDSTEPVVTIRLLRE